MIKAIIFDLDHTLFDRYATLSEIAKKLSKMPFINHALTTNEIADIMITADKKFIHYGWEVLEKYVFEKTSLFSEKMQNGDYFNFVLNEFKNIAVPFSFSKPMLLSLRSSGFKTGLITNGSPDLQNKKINMLGIKDCFDKIIIGDEIGFPKPSAVPFEIMSQKLNLKPYEMMYVGDHPLNDVDASRKAGYVPVFVNTSGFWSMPEVEKCELAVKTVAEIPALVNKYNKSLK